MAHSLAAVDDDVLGPDAAFQLAHLGVVPSPTEQTRGLNTEVPNSLLVVVHHAVAIFLQSTLILLLDFLQAKKRIKINGIKNNPMLHSKSAPVQLFFVFKWLRTLHTPEANLQDLN